MSKFKTLVKSLRPCKIEHWLLLSILFYSLVGVLKYHVPGPWQGLVTSVCGFGFICVVIKNAIGCSLKGLTLTLYVILSLWTFFLTLRMLFIDDVRATFLEYKGITTWLLAYFNTPYFLPNLMPLILLALPRRDGFDFRYLWRVMWLLAILYLCYFPFAFWSMTHYSWSFDNIGAEWGDAGTFGDFVSNGTKGIASLAPVVIMVFFKKYLSARQWKWFLTASVCGILIQAYMGRRGGLATSILYLLLAWMMYMLNDKKTSKVKVLLLFVMVIGVGYLLFNNLSDSFFSTLVARGIEDTRSGVEQGFYSDMSSASDWFLGRGWFGQYYEPIFGEKRSSIETGYLALILRGGLLYLIPYVMILVLSFFNGYFRSRNLFCKSFAFICLMQVVSLYPFGWPQFNFLHFVIWLGVWVCNSRYIRQLNDEQIKALCF